MGASKNGKPRRPLRVLLIEDSEPDGILLMRALERGGFEPIEERVDTPEAMNAALEKDWDLILADHAMPRFSAPQALRMIQDRGLDVPFIIVSGHIEEETAVAAMKSGAHDYIMKDRLARLVPAVERELREAEIRRARTRSEEELRRAHDELEMRVEQRTADLRQANVKLQNVIEERRRLENELLEIAENERRRIGFDLHDDLGQRLTGASLMTKGLEHKLTHENHECAAEAGKIQVLIEDIIHRTHDLARQFSSLDMRGDDLPGALAGLAANVKKMFDITCTCAVEGKIPTFPQNVVAQLYKIAQEAVSNAIKHGHATRVAIGLSRIADEVELTIKNDGTPFTPPVNARNRMGLRIMNYRASTIGASFEIKPNQKSGTLVNCRLLLREYGPARPDSREDVLDGSSQRRWADRSSNSVAEPAG